MEQVIYIYANPKFDARFKCGISRIYQVFCSQYGYKIEIVDDEFLKNNVPDENSGNIIVIAGGDGTLHRVINTIPDNILEKYQFGMLPGGTANEFAKSFNIPLNLEWAAHRIINKKSITRAKIGVLNNEYRFATGFLYGILVHILQNTDEKSKFLLGEHAYQLPGLIAISNYSDFIRKFRINSLNFNTAYLLINNASLKSKNINTNGLKSEENDYFAFIYLHSKITFRDLTRLMLKNQAEDSILLDPAIYYRANKYIKLEFEGELEFMLDGEFYKESSPLEFLHSGYEISIIA